MNFTKLVRHGTGFGCGGLRCECCVPAKYRKKALRTARKRINKMVDKIVQSELSTLNQSTD